MTRDEEEVVDERSRLLADGTRPSAQSIISAHLSKEEQGLHDTAIGERLPYNDYTTIDWLHDLVQSSYHYRRIHARPGLRYAAIALFDSSQGWIIAAFSGVLTAMVAAFVDLAVTTVSDWKSGYCTSNVLLSKGSCCARGKTEGAGKCHDWYYWTTNYWTQYLTFVCFALVFGIISASVTMTTKRQLPTAAPGQGDQGPIGKSSSTNKQSGNPPAVGKIMYMAAGSGIPEIKTILSGFVIPHFLDLKVLTVKAVGSVFAVSTGMCLGKEGPFVHISVCVADLVGRFFPKYADNGRKIREVYAAGCAAGLSVAFGAPIGGVLFAYEEIATYFPRKVLWRSFICSLCAAMTLRQLDPTGSGRLVLFETNYGTTYKPYHYPVFALLGVLGGLFGGIFCKFNFIWARWFRTYPIIKKYPVFEVFLVVLATALLQYPNPLTREPGDAIIKNLLVDCSGTGHSAAYVCREEGDGSPSLRYIVWLIYGSLVKLVLTIITFGIKVPSGVIIPALNAGAFTGRLIGQLSFLTSTISPGIFAMVGAASFLAGTCRMTISLAVIMFELTGELEFVIPNMIGIMIAKWVADALEKDGVYDLAQTVLGHPFLDLDTAQTLVRKQSRLVEELIPPEITMREIKVEVGASGRVGRGLLEAKLRLLERRGLMDAGLVLVQKGTGMLLGYLAQGELAFGLSDLSQDLKSDCEVQLLAPSHVSHESGLLMPEVDGPTPSASYQARDGELDRDITHPSNFDEASNEYLDLTQFIDRTPLTISASAPMEYAVEMFGKLGLRYLMVTEQTSGPLVGVIIKKRLVDFLDRLKHA